MGSKIQKYQKSYALQLLRLAAADAHAASVLMKDNEVRPEIVLFTIQQAVEKALKAVVCWREKPIPLTHDLYALVLLLEPSGPPGGYDLHDLTPYATIRRYEEGEAEIVASDLELALGLGLQVIEWGKKECDGAC